MRLHLQLFTTFCKIKLFFWYFETSSAIIYHSFVKSNFFLIFWGFICNYLPLFLKSTFFLIFLRLHLQLFTIFSKINFFFWYFWGFIFNYLPFFCKIKFFFIFWGFICNYLPLFVKSNVFFDIKKIKIRFLIVNLNSKIFAENVLFGTPYGNQLFLWKKSKKVEKNQKNTKKRDYHLVCRKVRFLQKFRDSNLHLNHVFLFLRNLFFCFCIHLWTMKNTQKRIFWKTHLIEDVKKTFVSGFSWLLIEEKRQKSYKKTRFSKTQ